MISLLAVDDPDGEVSACFIAKQLLRACSPLPVKPTPGAG